MLRSRVLELFDYDPSTGFFTHKIGRGRARAGVRAGSPTGHGYRKLTIDYAKHYEHRIAWLIVHGEWPDEIDHIDGDGSNNAISNLRLATRTQNNFNRGKYVVGQSGFRGVYWHPRMRKWYSKIQIGGRVLWLGHHDSPEQAHAAYVAAAERYAGEYAYHRRDSNHQSAEPLDGHS